MHFEDECALLSGTAHPSKVPKNERVGTREDLCSKRFQRLKDPYHPQETTIEANSPLSRCHELGLRRDGCPGQTNPNMIETAGKGEILAGLKVKTGPPGRWRRVQSSCGGPRGRNCEALWMRVV
jgi:hypothetical protein